MGIGNIVASVPHGAAVLLEADHPTGRDGGREQPDSGVGVDQHIGLPDRSTERSLLLGAGGEPKLAGLDPVVALDELCQAIALLAAAPTTGPIADYVLGLAGALRSHPHVRLGPSPRACLVLVRVARGLAVLEGRHYITPDDVQRAAVPVLAHRISLERGATVDDQRRLVSEALGQVPVPV